LHDRGSYRYCASVLDRAHAAGVALPAGTREWFTDRRAIA